ncbi:MAG: hypothetical protein J7513_00675, partial [Solirubrobacteraceae bacterium]|nr:hypothetical protein [Solirubrobacteraceae bacterium]
AELSVIENSYEVWRQVGGLRALNDADYAFYPALSAPLGAPDPLTCPASHIRFLEEELARQDRLDVLMLGYSGLDDEVLRIFRASGKPLGQIQAACGAGSQEALNALVRAIRGDTLMGVPVASGETFSQFVTGTGLGTYLAHRR